MSGERHDKRGRPRTIERNGDAEGRQQRQLASGPEDPQCLSLTWVTPIGLKTESARSKRSFDVSHNEDWHCA
ncbi:hypothetical protein R69919_01844 [Paraburkholderia gardini]|uniref:Uncharacterized protein n=1 Tax=Paraburkholderia gardini TaxID=2823469 RepID=A0ABN7QYN0_9BURK|nr:hypothetical protein R69919_01844 [Paraburkholderia gardini]CAG4922126.1 hypothetical protein R54767_04862 [Paraburkholderia gardini]